MMRSNKFYSVTVTILMLLMIAVPSLAQDGSSEKRGAARIRLGMTDFAPGERETNNPSRPYHQRISAGEARLLHRTVFRPHTTEMERGAGCNRSRNFRLYS